MAKRRVSNLLGLAVLSYLTQGPMHAYEMQRQLKRNDAAQTFRLSYGALYSVVHQLAEAGFIAEVATGQHGNLPRHTVYELTAAGREELRAWLRSLIVEPEHEYPAFAAALSLIVVLPPAEVADLLQQRLRTTVSRAAAVTSTRDAALAGGVHPVFLVEDDYRVALLRAEAAFVSDLITRVTDPDTGWGPAWEAHLAGPPGSAGDENTPKESP